MTDWATSQRRARKERPCTLCNAPIRVGNTYTRTATFDDGMVSVRAEHPYCLDILPEAAESALGGYWDPYEGWNPAEWRDFRAGAEAVDPWTQPKPWDA